MALDPDGSYTALATGHGLAFELAGPTIAACLERAVEAFAESVADIHPSRLTTPHAVEITGPTPSALLLGVVEECLRWAREGRVAVCLHDGEVTDGVLHGVVETVAAGDAGLRGALPHVLSWHEVSMDGDPASGRWRGRVVAR